MYFLKQQLIELALQQYALLDSADPAKSDQFFATFCPGQRFSISDSDPVDSYRPDQPFERLSDYEELLKLIQKADPEKYRVMHKGTPFYFMAWLAFDLNNYEKALFLMDAAISEDIRKSPNNWLNQPAGSFLALNSARQISEITIKALSRKLTEQIARFNRISNLPSLSLQQFVDQFVNTLVQDKTKRTIISAFYVYLLEYEDRFQELKMRSTEGGSIEPVIMHLFTGGVIFESLLKYLYRKDDDKPCKTLGEIFITAAFTKDFGTGFSTSADSIQDILNTINDSNSLATSFDTTAKLRNTTGHNLVWDDVFAEPKQYEKLFYQQVNALLYLISIKFCKDIERVGHIHL